MLLAAIIVLNIPVYLFIGWLVFDTKDKAAMTFLETIVFVVRRMFIPPIVSAALGWGDDDIDGSGCFSMVVFFVACIAIVWGEYYLINKWFFAD